MMDDKGRETINGGVFFMLWEDFQKYFALVDIARVNDNANYIYYEEKFSLDKPVLYQFTSKGKEINLSISQTDLRGQKSEKGKPLRLANAILVLGKQVSSTM